MIRKFNRWGTKRSMVWIAIPLMQFSFCAETLQAQSLAQRPIVFPIMAPRLSSGFGKRNHPVYRATRHHHGVDLAVPEGCHVRTVSPGRVIFAGTYAGYGKLVTVRHDTQTVSLYGHLNEVSVVTGQTVNAGEVIGRVGSTGLATGPHLHFEWRKDDRPVDPLTMFPQLVSEADG